MKPILTFLLFVICFGGVSATKTITYRERLKDKDSLNIHEGILCQTAQKIKYKSLDGTCAFIHLSEPVMVAQANQYEKWGYFQFPLINKTDDGKLIVSWQMKEDSHKTYGKNSGRECPPMMSKDGGLTWVPQDKSFDVHNRNYKVSLNDGCTLQVITPQSKNVFLYSSFPDVVGKKGKYAFYFQDSLPDELKGVYFKSIDVNRKTEIIHAKLLDPGLLRYAIDGLMPIVWWGDIKKLEDNSLVAGIYPTFYMNNKGDINDVGVSFYRSQDNGRSWGVLGKIPFIRDGIAEIDREYGFTEPTFEILKDSSFLCVMRSGSVSPMYKATSCDNGVTWTTPKPFTPNGVNPQLLLLGNGVLVLASGRPGIQIRFSLDGMGCSWTDPIDMIPFMKADKTYNRDVSCGYVSIVENDDNSFYLTYSDFTTKDAIGQNRKSIVCRKITVKKIN